MDLPHYFRCEECEHELSVTELALQVGTGQCTECGAWYQVISEDSVLRWVRYRPKALHARLPPERAR